MRLSLAVLLVVSGISGAARGADEPPMTFRWYLGDIFKMYGQASPNDRSPLASYCEIFAKEEAKRRGGGDVWQGMVSECLGYAQLSDEDGYPLAACAYFIEAAAHYGKARPEAYEIEALERSREEMTRQIAGLGC
jgi:hypothetical protein